MKKFWLGLALGAVAGGVAALLLAPRSGYSTRRKVRRSLEDLGDNFGDVVREQAERWSKEALALFHTGKVQVDEVLNAAQDYAAVAGDYAKAAGDKVSLKTSRLM